MGEWADCPSISTYFRGQWDDGREGGTIEHTNSQTDVLLGPFVTVDGGREVLKSSKIS